MDHHESNEFVQHDSSYMGAIFMCNRETKKECLKRKLFGLPCKQAGFVNKIKTGMLLFLFEYEERKLYGVFEATSDGALNIMPDAFISSGKTYPAQILFKRLWYCKSLSEDDFSGAIKENYYQPNKFNFGLSYDQVIKLVQLFHSKKIRLQLYQGRGMPNKLIKEFEEQYCSKNKFSGTLHNYSMDNMVSRNNYSDLSGSCMNRSLTYRYPDDRKYSDASGSCMNKSLTCKYPFLTSEYPIFGSQHGFSPTDFGATKRQTELVYSKSTERTPQNFSLHTSSGMKRDFDQQQTAWVSSSVDKQVPLTRSQLPSDLDDNFVKAPSPNHHSLDVSRSHITNAGFTYEPSRVNLPLIGSEGYNETHDYRKLSMRNLNFSTFRDSSSLGIFARKTEPLHSASVSGSPRVNPTASELENGSRGRLFSFMDSLPDFIPLPEDDGLVNNNKYLHARCMPRMNFVQQNYLSESEEDGENEELIPYQLMCDLEDQETFNDDCYPTVVTPRLHSDIGQRRTSVFSRLSKAPETHLTYPHSTCLPNESSSLKQHSNHLTLKRNSLTKQTFKQLSSLADDKSCGTITDMDTGKDSSFYEFESQSATIAIENIVSPFLNFKRRSEVRKVGKGAEFFDAEDRKDGKSVGKRRRLVRPVLEEESQINLLTVVEGCMSVASGGLNRINEESSIASYEDVANKSSSPVSATDKLENTSDCSAKHTLTEMLGESLGTGTGMVKTTENDELSGVSYENIGNKNSSSPVLGKSSLKDVTGEGKALESAEVERTVNNLSAEVEKTVNNESSVGSYINNGNKNSPFVVPFHYQATDEKENPSECSGNNDKLDSNLGGF